MSPRASIVIPTRGGAARLPYLLECLRQQTEPSWEAIAVIDGDIDDSAAVVAAAGRELPVRAIVFDHNRGRAAALNAGFDAATGDVLIRCDDDLRPGPDWVADHVAAHDDGPVGVIGLCRNVFPPTPYARAYGMDRDHRFRTDAYAVAPDRAWRYWGANVSAGRTLWAAVGPYDHRFRTYGWEDVDWGYRIHLTGTPVRILPALETDHHIAATTTETRVRRAFHSGAARLRFVAKHGSEALGSTRRDRSAWNRLVEGTADRAGLDRLTRWARRVDRTADRLPRWVAEKQISLLVEAAALSGERHPDEVTTTL